MRLPQTGVSYYQKGAGESIEGSFLLTAIEWCDDQLSYVLTGYEWTRARGQEKTSLLFKDFLRHFEYEEGK